MLSGRILRCCGLSGLTGFSFGGTLTGALHLFSGIALKRRCNELQPHLLSTRISL
ncbi:hypothetical protein OH77DRAFT_1430491 [Trametes cingulata]|nr:hypothetical protein OH77DRAFT_1430491 [Trametes cingulata]